MAIKNISIASPDLLTLDRAPGRRQQDVPEAVLSWHVSDAVVEGRAVGIKGRTGLLAGDDGWRLGETRLLDVRQKEAVPDCWEQGRGRLVDAIGRVMACR